MSEIASYNLYAIKEAYHDTTNFITEMIQKKNKPMFFETLYN